MLPTLTTCRIATGKECRPRWPKLDEFREKCRKGPYPARRLHCSAQSTQVEVPSNLSRPRKAATAQNVHSGSTKLRNTLKSCQLHLHKTNATRAHAKLLRTRSFHRLHGPHGNKPFQLHRPSAMLFRSSPRPRDTEHATTTTTPSRDSQTNHLCRGKPKKKLLLQRTPCSDATMLHREAQS